MNPTFISHEASASGTSPAPLFLPQCLTLLRQSPLPAPRRFQSLRRFCRRLYYLLRAFVPLPHRGWVRGEAFNSYLTSVETLMELENTGTILIDHRRPGVVVAMEYLTLWNRAYAHYGDDRILHAWCDKFRAVINLRRGIRSTRPAVSSTVPDASPSVTPQQPGSAGAATPVLPETPLHIVVVEPDDYTKPWAIGLETATTITLQKVEDTALNPYLK